MCLCVCRGPRGVARVLMGLGVPWPQCCWGPYGAGCAVVAGDAVEPMGLGCWGPRGAEVPMEVPWS